MGLGRVSMNYYLSHSLSIRMSKLLVTVGKQNMIRLLELSI